MSRRDVLQVSQEARRVRREVGHRVFQEAGRLLPEVGRQARQKAGRRVLQAVGRRMRQARQAAGHQARWWSLWSLLWSWCVCRGGFPVV